MVGQGSGRDKEILICQGALEGDTGGKGEEEEGARARVGGCMYVYSFINLFIYLSISPSIHSSSSYLHVLAPHVTLLNANKLERER